MEHALGFKEGPYHQEYLDSLFKDSNFELTTRSAKFEDALI